MTGSAELTANKREDTPLPAQGVVSGAASTTRAIGFAVLITLGNHRVSNLGVAFTFMAMLPLNNLW